MRSDVALGLALVMGLILAAGAAIPLAGSRGLATSDQRVPVVALVNHSAAGSALFLGQFCGGVVVAPRRVVTASHCLAGRAPQTVDVVGGVQDLCAEASVGTLRRSRVGAVSALPGSSGTLIMLELEAVLEPEGMIGGPVGDSGAVTAIPGSAVSGWGWGRDAVAGIPACRLRAAPLVVVDPGRCARIASVTYARAQGAVPPDQTGAPSRAPYLCAVPDGDVNTCTGDSGGPVTAPDPVSGVPRVIAVTMSGTGCGPGSLGLAILLGEL